MLVLASDTSPIYVRLQYIWRQYMKSSPNIDCYFYKSDPNLDADALLEGDTLWVRSEESLDTVYEKTLKAFSYFAEKLNEYDFVFRPNISSFVVFDKYIEACRSFPKNRFVSAFVGWTRGSTFPSGSGFTMSPDVVIELIKDKPPMVEVDDVTIGVWLNTRGIAIHPAPRCDYIDSSEIPHYRDGTEETTFHYRVKNANRNIDIVIHKMLYKHFYAL